MMVVMRKSTTRMNFFAVDRPEGVTGQGLGITGINPDAFKHLVGIGTDGASANISAASMNGRFGCGVWLTGWSWPSRMPSHLNSLMRCFSDCITYMRSHHKSVGSW